MQIRPVLTGSAAVLIAAVATPARASAQIGVQRTRNTPQVYAITNARVVPVSGPTIERGTVIVRDGLIAAVGASVRVPGDATTIDGAGLTVYPGLIDANSSLGLAGAAPSVAVGRGAARGGAPAVAQQGEAAPNSLHPAGLQPELDAANLVSSDVTLLSGPHSAGIATALTGPNNGIFRGEAAIVDLSGAVQSASLKTTSAVMHAAAIPKPVEPVWA